ncbi:hypothetical protein BO86DRAFT_388509 [Aspergillus japonicus CBS 114.51]|uniref:Ribosomal protein L34 n=1 Tax=Aspergillus japonicus CBS 114.51 TaxID=1448312 RepID=A0A8T8X3G6_ASPJA|nr:hypothetical protein BO86DRAFT_388509 [Aspergillus japonicus CBS 114.51]RAH82668.1 hypothetical protein BO86DRAFT_388509 [Aspergillus japonicus CBS 114.51]
MTAATRIPISAHAAAAARASTARAATTTTTTSIRTLITSSSAFSPLRAQLSHQPRTPSTILSTSAFPHSSTITSPAAQQQSRSFSASACLLGKRSTYNPSRRVQKRRHGFLSRVKTRTGRMIIQRRKARGRKNLSW